MSVIGEFTINALNKMCAGCPNPKLNLDCTRIETFESGEKFSYHLYCENQDKCSYAFSQGRLVIKDEKRTYIADPEK